MSLFSKQIDKRIAAYQRELIETHYREWTICTGRFGVGGMTTATISRP